MTSSLVAAYAKAENLLMDLRQRGEFTDYMFAETQPVVAEQVMDVLDQINAKRGARHVAPGWGATGAGLGDEARDVESELYH
ncbi:hypothetical protein NTD81_09215 [Pseudomonas sp. 5P_3.1_Bac2]|nr:hypothetical protein [Pseudomonas sp. 5P_3.1_Bac2]MCU1717299.1 hypothetical protein [Pseudomonas sp. 5P_3.1_Bac2]